ncbi:aldehyde dehydrogenase family protein [Vibrio algivorus]|uniref:NAD-dependent succinate-semialdehyde dehydrogenase n=1 Tax=Vibrio algivorus TaxID=1667024 RepID=A0ABQ6ERV5_9VIBR|nr:aldehyde dehydrogenase family protein [Vibrio algivorus]GLT15305.1 NAD-dependent succinate-semialdehyde dehydrogenase [Vibrio algivorus]
MSPYLYINGQLVNSHQQKTIFNPATDEKISSIYIADKTIADQALNCAKDAEFNWGRLSINKRIIWMRKLRSEFIKQEEYLRNCVHQETGKTWKDTLEDFQLLIDSMEFYSKISSDYLATETVIDDTHSHAIIKIPVGTCIAYLAWNFPLLNIGYKLAPAMASGCPIIIKPSIQTPLSAYAVGEICHSIGLPKGAVQILAGDDIELGNHMSSSTIPAMLTLIGSTNTGLKVIEKSTTSIKHFSMELGGDAPFIILDDANQELAADILHSIKFTNAGQTCVSANRVFVADSILESFIEKVLQRLNTIKLGWHRDSDATMGALINKTARNRIHELVVDALNKGATCLSGGDFSPEETGSFYPPTLLVNVTADMKIYQQEIFGPVIAISSFKNIQEAINKANMTKSGLASYIFTNDSSIQKVMTDELDFGEVHVNGIKYSIELPHTGIKQSGIGCDCSKYSLNDFTALKRISTPL